MTQPIVLSFTGPDKPGLVDTLASVVARFDGNWEDSHMARLAGRFAGVVLISLPSAQIPGLTAAVAALDAHGLRVTVELGEDETRAPAAALHLEVIGTDQPGIVRQLARALAERGVNIEELSTERFEAPMSGGAMFSVMAHLNAPVGTDLDALEEALAQLSDDLQVEITFGNLVDDEDDEADGFGED